MTLRSRGIWTDTAEEQDVTSHTQGHLDIIAITIRFRSDAILTARRPSSNLLCYWTFRRLPKATNVWSWTTWLNQIIEDIWIRNHYTEEAWSCSAKCHTYPDQWTLIVHRKDVVKSTIKYIYIYVLDFSNINVLQ